MRTFITSLALFLAATTALAAPVPKPTEEEKRLQLWGKVADPAGDCKVRVVKNQLVMSTPGGIRSGQTKKLRVEQEVEDDFEVEVKMIRMTEASHAAPRPLATGRVSCGLFIGKDDAKYMEFGQTSCVFPFNCHDCSDCSIWLWHNRGGTRIADMEVADEICVRLTRKGNKVSKAYSKDGKDWTVSAILKSELPQKVTVGVCLWHDVDQPCEAVFEHFKLTPLKKEK